MLACLLGYVRSSGAPRSLVGARPADEAHFERAHASAVAERPPLLPPAVDHVGDPGDGQRGLRDVRGDDDEAVTLRRRLEDRRLLPWSQHRVEGKDPHRPRSLVLLFFLCNFVLLLVLFVTLSIDLVVVVLLLGFQLLYLLLAVRHGVLLVVVQVAHGLQRLLEAPLLLVLVLPPLRPRPFPTSGVGPISRAPLQRRLLPGLLGGRRERRKLAPQALAEGLDFAAPREEHQHGAGGQARVYLARLRQSLRGMRVW